MNFLNISVPIVTTPLPLGKRSNPPKVANAKSNDPPENNDLPKVVTSKVISLFARNNGSYRYNKLCQTHPRFISNGYNDPGNDH